MIKEIELFNEKIPIRNYLCSNIKDKIIEGDYHFNLYIKITDYCNAKCPFCINQSSVPKKEEIDLDKLELVLRELKSKKMLNRISFTGGEPLLYIDRLNKIINKVFEVIPDAVVTINTNGINFDKIKQIEKLSKLEGIHISRHHFDDKINDDIFKVKTATNEQIKALYDSMDNKKLIRLNCLLIDGYIDNIDKVKEYLDYASKIGVFRVGFVSLMPGNDYCKEHYINYNDIFKDLDSNFFKAAHYYDTNICECSNGLYLADNGNLVEFYARMTKELSCDYMRQLVYTPSNELLVGFNNKKIIIPDNYKI